MINAPSDVTTLGDNMSGNQRLLIASHAWHHEQFGGAFKIATELAEYLAGGGHRVFYVCGTDEPAPLNPTVVKGVELWRYTYPKKNSPHPANLWGHVRGAYRLTREILRRSPVDCVNGHSPLQFLGASLAAGRQSGRQVYSVHSPFVDELDSNWQTQRPSLKRRIGSRLARVIEGINCRRATEVQCFSQFTGRRLTELYGRGIHNKIHVSPGWVDVDRFHPVDNVEEIRADLGAPWQSDCPIFFTVRRLEARMGLDFLIEAARLLRAQKFDFRLLIGGGGSLESELRRQVQAAGLGDTVRLLGRIPESDLPKCFAAADCFVLPTRALECFGLIILEAFASGTPVIGTPVGAIPELVVRQGSQWLTTNTTALSIADRIAAFLQGKLVSDRQRLRGLAEQWGAKIGLDRLAHLLLPAARAEAI